MSEPTGIEECVAPPFFKDREKKMRKFWLLSSSLVLGFAVGVLLPNMAGCVKVAPQVVVTPPQAVAPAATPEKPKADKQARSVEDAEKELAEARKAAAAASEEKAKADNLVKAKEKELADARITEQQHRLYWVVGWSLLAALGCVAGAIFLTGVRKYFIYGVIASVAVAACAIVFAAILPYLLYIGIGLLVAALGFVLYCWRNDHKGLRQVTTAVETFKEHMPGYKEHFKTIIDTDVDGWLNRTRKNLGLLKK
jgi:hypothetical protein